MPENFSQTVLLSGERVDDLQYNGLKIIQHPGRFRFGSDAVELADFVSGGARDRAADLGSGTGIIAILLAGKKKINVTAVEIQSEMAEMSRRSVRLNNLDGFINIINAPMQDISKFAAAGSYTIVVSNPPYRRKGSGESQEEESARISRHEVAVTLSEVADTAAYLLSTAGAFYLIHQTERLAEVIAECAKRRLEPKILQILAPKEGKQPHLFMLKCVKDGKTGLKVLSERVIDAKA